LTIIWDEVELMAFKYGKIKSEKKNTGLYVFFGILGLLLFLLTASALSFISNRKGLPDADLLLCLVCAACAFMPAKRACVFALVFGLFADLFLFAPTAFSPIVYMIAVLLTSRLYRGFSKLGSVVMAVCSIPAFAVKNSVDTVVTLTLFRDASLKKILIDTSLPFMLINFAWAIVICFVCRKLILHLRLDQ
jgi:cell shape-determining protein MreD